MIKINRGNTIINSVAANDFKLLQTFSDNQRYRNQVRYGLLSNSFPYKITVDIVVNQKSLYKGAYFNFEITFPPDFPFSPPQIRCLNKVCHLNIDIFTGSVLLPQILPQNWNVCYKISDITRELDQLVLNYNQLIPSNQVNVYLAELRDNQLDQFVQIVQQTLQGGLLWDIRFYPNYQEQQKRGLKRRGDNMIQLFSKQKSRKCDIASYKEMVVQFVNYSLNSECMEIGDF